jgi:hypothetical protein
VRQLFARQFQKSSFFAPKGRNVQRLSHLGNYCDTDRREYGKAVALRRGYSALASESGKPGDCSDDAQSRP